ncbi:hypothetical protein ACJX0J_040257 [Zea mays]
MCYTGYNFDLHTTKIIQNFGHMFTSLGHTCWEALELLKHLWLTHTTVGHFLLRFADLCASIRVDGYFNLSELISLPESCIEFHNFGILPLWVYNDVSISKNNLMGNHFHGIDAHVILRPKNLYGLVAYI